MNWLKKRESRVDTDKLLIKAEESLEQTHNQQPHVNYITAWLNSRRIDNGLGEDFEVTLVRPRRT